MKKKDGSLRFCVDFRQLNAATVKETHPIPRIDNLLDALQGARWFSTLDLKSGYWQVPIQEQDKEKTACRTSSGQLFEFNQVPFWPLQHSRYLLQTHGPRPTWSPQGNLPLLLGRHHRLHRYLRGAPRLPPPSLRASQTCATRARRRQMYLHRQGGQLLQPSSHQRRPPTRSLSASPHQGDQSPEERHGSSLYSGSRRVLLALHSKLPANAGLLHALTRKDAFFHWGPDCQDTFDRLKTLLTTSPITAFPDFSLPFRLYTDASTSGLGAILAQVREDKERIICCASRSLNQVEKAYPATKLECLAIVWAVAKFRPYLMSMPFEVYTDHYALQWMKTMRTGPTLLHRWSAALEEYDFTVKHRPGILRST